jgi:CRP/FNR family transcriptional regulator, cyclic AMP receptor protein
MFEATQRMRDFTLQVYSSMGVSPAAAFEAGKQSRVISRKAGDMIWRTGAPITHWHHIIEGMVAEQVTMDQGLSYPLTLHSRNSCFAKHDLLGDGKAQVDYLAVTDVELLTLPASAYLALVRSDAGFAQHLLGELSSQIRQQNNQLIVNKCSNSALRVIGGLALCAEGLCLQAEASESLPPPEDDSLMLPLSQQMIARLCGVSRTLFSEYIGQLEQGNWVRLQYRGVELQNLSAWRGVFVRLHSHQVWRRNPPIEALLSLLAECAADRQPRYA